MGKQTSKTKTTKTTKDTHAHTNTQNNRGKSLEKAVLFKQAKHGDRSLLEGVMHALLLRAALL